MADDQKAMKKRLKLLMNKPENQVCSDCSERQPRWASLIVPPPGAPPNSGAIGAFCCLECSGSHRRLGVHISFVRSINLDSWKEKEVLAMENGGNAKVNAIFEARLAQTNSRKPTNHADGPTRERFIRDKYERRKFYDANAFAEFQQTQYHQQQQQQQQAAPQASRGVGPPSDAARQRMEERQRRMKKSDSGLSLGAGAGEPVRRPPVRKSSSSSRDGAGRRRPPSRAASADLLDLLTPDPAASHTPNMNASVSGGTSGNVEDLFSASARDFFDEPTSSGPRRPPERKKSSRSSSGVKKSQPVSQDIMSLYQTNNPSSGFQHQSQGNGNAFDMSTMNTMMNQMGGGMSQPQANMMMMNNNNNMMGGGNMSMTPQQQQQMMMMQQYQQQQMMMMQQQQQGGGGMMANNNMFAPQQQSPQMMMMQGNNNNSNDAFGGLPMGSGPSMNSMNSGGQGPGMTRSRSSRSKQSNKPEKEDPFAQFSVNAFR